MIDHLNMQKKRVIAKKGAITKIICFPSKTALLVFVCFLFFILNSVENGLYPIINMIIVSTNLYCSQRKLSKKRQV